MESEQAVVGGKGSSEPHKSLARPQQGEGGREGRPPSVRCDRICSDGGKAGPGAKLGDAAGVRPAFHSRP